MWSLIIRSTCVASLLATNSVEAEGADNAASASAASDTASAAPLTPNFDSLRIKGLIISLPGPQDTIDPDVGGVRSALASLGIGYLVYNGNSFFYNTLPVERTTFGRQAYNGQQPTFQSNNVVFLTYDLSRYGIPDGQIVVGGTYLYDTWNPGGPNALSLSTLSYYQTFFDKRVELKLGYLNNTLEFWGPLLSGNLASSIFGSSATLPVELGINATAWTTPGIDIKFNGPGGFYDKLGVQRASNPDGPVAEKIANPTGLDWSTPNSGILFINEFGYKREATPGQLATWIRAAPMFNTSNYVDYAFGGRRTGNYAAYFLVDQQFLQLAPIAGQAARGIYGGVSAIYAPPEFNRFSQYYEFRLYGIGLMPSRPRDMVSLVISRNVFSHYLVDTALQQGQLAHSDSLSITAAYTASLAPGIQGGIGLGYTNHPTSVTYTPQTGSALNILANITTFW